jgi:phage terminase large subunit
VAKARATFDWKRPDEGYELIWEQRAIRLQKIRNDRAMLAALQVYYRDNPWDFIADWGVTYDPRRLDLGLDPVIPFVLFEKQIDWCKFVVAQWKAREPGLTEKSRECGVSWLAVALGATLCLFYPGFAGGYGAAVQELVDEVGNPKSLFWKARFFLDELPREFKGGWDKNRHAPFMRILFPNGSSMIGESGDQIGRGNRTSISFLDESAHLPRPKLVDAALSQTTNCRIDISTPNGNANSFYYRAHSGKVKKFTFHWRDDPRKDEVWYQKQINDIDDPVIIAQELDINYAASVTGVVIPHEWVMAAIDAHLKIGLQPTGERSGAMDVADGGKDKNSFVAAHGVLLTDLDEWSGKETDIFDSVERSFRLADKNECRGFKYDADGLGAGVKGDARIINQARKASSVRELDVTTFRGSGKVFNPEGEDVKGRKNEDFFQNLKAQAWWALRTRFRNTYRLVKENRPCSHDDIICIPSTLPFCTRLTSELSQPTFAQSAIGKLMINKQPDGTKSPNLGDAVMMKFARVERAPMKISDQALKAVSKMQKRRR